MNKKLLLSLNNNNTNVEFEEKIDIPHDTLFYKDSPHILDYISTPKINEPNDKNLCAGKTPTTLDIQLIPTNTKKFHFCC